MRRVLGELVRYRSAVSGLVIIGFFTALSVYAVIAVPYPEAIRLWRGGEELWQYNPRAARPEWVNWFLREDLPRTLVVEGTSEVWSARPLGGEVREAMGVLSFAYPYRRPPSELGVFLEADYRERMPQVELSWVAPGGPEVRIAEFAVRRREVYRLSSDPRLQQELGGRPEVVLFSPPDRPEEAVQGQYALRVRAYLFEPDSEVRVRLVVYGEVHGLAGTDHLRRDLSLALLWGTPVAMAFGLVASVGSSVSTLVIAALGAWYGGWVDGLIQRITEVNLILPGLPILIMIATLYSRSLPVMVGVVILLGIFGGGIKTYRALFLQVKESPYIEAARAYGASGLRIVFLYMVPRAVPILVPQFVTLIPGFVFLEATLSVLGLGDPLLPTWGKVIEDAYRAGALYVGQYYWVLEPASLLMLAGLGFTLLGFALDRIFNPRLREL
ncbi:MAG: ABC transporter permease [Armatimonadota bacterium]|nr:ABC transporter permease [Armatimonadota bacterium]MDR7443917.1 ABC transporter permease [Armatimonadota bacterium]MDR7570425.1 ABC transporter permease [Armatimonadota bacterium]MDR7613224.1 ABC transporter permease [Armatimonadota bacterium]